MGKRVAGTSTTDHHSISPSNVTPIATRSIRKRKRNAAAVAAKTLRLANYWHENDDEDSSSNDTPTTATARNQSSKHANNSSILLNSFVAGAAAVGDTSVNESPKPVYTLHPSVINGTILYDLTKKPWRLGRPIGKGNFGEIFLASDNISVPVSNESAKFVVKIEPHSNGPLFVEIHCLINTAKKNSNIEDGDDDVEYKQHTKLPSIPPSGIPDYIASGSHYFGDARYRFLVLQRFDRDLHSLIKNCRVHQKSVITMAIQIVNVLESLHDKGYCHNDVKAQNLMISKCEYYKREMANGKSRTEGATASIKSKYYENYEEKQQTTDSGNSSEQEANDDENGNFLVKRNPYRDDDEEDEDFDDGMTSNSNDSNSMNIYETPVNRNRKRRPRNALVEFSGSNPVRSCRRQKRNSIYEEMVKSHYLRPTKRVSYSEFFNEDGMSVKGNAPDSKPVSSDDESDEFLPNSSRRSSAKKKSSSSTYVTKRLTRRQEKLLAVSSANNNHNHHQYIRSVVRDELVAIEEERIFLIDFGLASKFMDNGVHRPFVMDQRRAHDGTLEFTSRDAHMGAHSRRSDLECLGYNLIFWSQGYLPWKDAATQHQREKVHRAKEYLMTDVREMLKQIYGKQVPKYLGEFLHHVGQLAYHMRPDYARYRRIFEREYQQLGYSLADMQLDSHEIVRTCVRVKEEIENKNYIFEMNKNNSNAWSIMKNLSVGTPFHERTLSNRVSPKNLRSKSDKKSLKKKKFSWAEILSQDPDQIARERAEKEFDREEELIEIQQPVVRRYEGKPTYAILEIQQRLRQSGRLVHDNTTDEEGNVDENDDDETENEEEEEVDEYQEEDNMEVENDEEETEELEDDEHGEMGVDIEENATEDSVHFETKGRTRGTRNAASRSVTISATSRKFISKGAATTISKAGRTRGNKKRTSTTKATTATRGRYSASTSTTKSTITQTDNRRGSNKRFKRKGANAGSHAASAAGEIEHSTPKYVENGHGHVYGGTGGGGVKLPERRTRRCLIKTEADVTEEEESNSNFSPDVRSLFNVWKKIDNESIYFRGSTAAARHCKK